MASSDRSNKAKAIRTSVSKASPKASSVDSQSVNDHSDTKDVGDYDTCGDCKKIVSRGHKALQCDVCRLWHHIGCEKVSADVYEFLCVHNDEAGLRWMCSKCQTTYLSVMNYICHLEKAHERLEEKVANMDKKLDNLMKSLDERKIDQIQQKLQESTAKLFDEKVSDMDVKFDRVLKDLGNCNADKLQHKLQEDLEEAEETRRRKTNVIIHGLHEPISGDTVHEHEQDEQNIEQLLHELKCDDVSVNNVIRLGRKPDGPDAKPRPVKLVLASEEHKDKILRGAKNLKHDKANGLDKVFIHQDLTPRQRAKRKELVEELKLRRSQGEENLIIVKDRIVVRQKYGIQAQESD